MGWSWPAGSSSIPYLTPSCTSSGRQIRWQLHTTYSITDICVILIINVLQTILQQLVRNVSLAFGAIAIVSVLLIADIVVSLLVFLCVALTLLDIAGGAYFMGLTIEIVTSIILILAVGLALDYSAHIGVTYVVTRGRNRREKTKTALSSIGMAVANGGISTLLAFVLWASSSSYVYLTFFKV